MADDHPERWRVVSSIFDEAVKLLPGRRAAYLEEACGTDAEMKAEVTRLLEAADRAEGFLEKPALSEAGDLLRQAAEELPGDSNAAGLDGRRAADSAAGGTGGRRAGDSAVPGAGGTSGSTDRPRFDNDPSGGPDPSQAPTATSGSAGAPFEQIGPYRLLQKIGEGGMGEVWLAEQTEPVRRKVALKLIKAGMDTKQVVARFEAERQALALMDHPAIAKVYEAGETPRGLPYFAMEHIAGEPITRYCDGHRLGTVERLKLFGLVCEGVQHAHQKGVIHRDLKPSNVLVAIQDGKPVPKIIDFGVAKATAQRLTERTMFTELGMLVGTPEYMSPEQAEMTGLNVDTRTDVYALGVILYELLTGALPFEPKELRAAGYDEIRRRIREVDPPRPSTRVSTMGEASTESAHNRGSEPGKLAGQLRGDLDWIVMKSLEKDRTRRYGSPNELAADLIRHLEHEPVLAGPPSTWYRSRKFVRRHRFGVAVASLAVAGLGAFGVTMAVQAKTIARERDRAERVSEFLVNLFKVSDPSEARGNSITAREVLDRGAAQIEKELGKEPLVQARMMLTMGIVYRNLGLYKQAEPFLTKSVDIRRKLLGERNPDTLVSLQGLAKLYQQQARYPEAEKLYLHLVETGGEVLGPNHRDTLTAMNGLAVVYAEEGHYDKSGPIYRQVLEVRRRILGPDHPDTLSSMNSVACNLRNEGRYAEAESLFRETVRARERVSGPDHPDTLVVEHVFAWLLFDTGRYAEAEKLARAVYETRRRVMGENHHAIANSADLLAGVLAHEGKLEEAESLYLESIELDRRSLGPEHPSTLVGMQNLAAVYVDRGKTGQAVNLFAQVLSALRRTLGQDHPSTLLCANNLGSTLIEQGRLDEAEALLKETFEKQRRLLGEKNLDTVYTMTSLASLAAARGQKSKALGLLKQAAKLGYSDADSLAKDPTLKSLQGDPAFQEILALAKKNTQK
jgi:eukaryotic-like serine/threonine-protein kinase